MAERNTPLINALIEQLNQHPDFEEWRRKGKISSAVVSQFCKSLKTDSRFVGQPARLYVSAEHAANYIFKSWLAIQKRLQQRLDGKLRWLEMLKSNEELAQESGVELAVIRDRASVILAQFQLTTTAAETASSQEQKGKSNKKIASTKQSLASQLFERYRNSKQVLERCAIAFLLTDVLL